MHRPFVGLWKQAIALYPGVDAVRWLCLGVVMGILSGMGAVLFFLGIEYFKHLFLAQVAGLHLPAPAGEALFEGGHATQYRPWMLPVMTTLVGLVTGWLVNRYIPETVHAGTDGTDATIRAFHQNKGRIRPLVPIIKGLTSILTIATGGSAGREGPITQIGAGLGSWLATHWNFSAKDRRILLLSGAAGGLGAIFRAPLGGALTAIEVIYREDFEAEAVLPSVLSSVVAYSMITFFFGTEPILGIPEFAFTDVRELIFYLILSVVCAATGWFYVKSFYFIKFSLFYKLHDRIGVMWTTALGGLIMGLMGMQFQELLSGGYGWLEMAINGALPVGVMIALIFGKTIATSVTLGSGMSGGMFAPALFVGGMSGGVVGYLAHEWYPNIVTQPGGYVLVGMAAFFAGVANAPIGPLIMVCELTQGYGLLAPLMLASAVCLVVNLKISLYENQVDNKFESPAHINDATINLLENLSVQEFYKPGVVATLEEGTTLKALTDIIAGTNDFYFPVRGTDGHISGILAMGDVREVLFEECLMDLVLVRDIARPPLTLTPDDDLYDALLSFIDTGLGQLPVVSPDDPTDIVGKLRREDVFQAYSETLKKLRED